MKRATVLFGCLLALSACAGAEDKHDSTPAKQPTAPGAAIPAIDLESTTETPAVAAVPGVGSFNTTGLFQISPDQGRPVVTLNLSGDQARGGKSLGMSVQLTAVQTKALMAGETVAIAGAASLNLSSSGRQDPHPVQRLRLERQGHGVSMLRVDVGGQVAMLRPDTGHGGIQNVMVKGQLWAACAAPLPNQGSHAVVFDPSFRTSFCRDALTSSGLDQLDD